MYLSHATEEDFLNEICLERLIQEEGIKAAVLERFF